MRQLSLLLISVCLLLIWGCSTPAERAEKLYKEGQFEEVITRYPQEPAAVKAKEALATKLLKAGDYARVMTEFPDTPMYHEARMKRAEQLLDEKNVDEILANYSDTPSAIRAREMAAQTLYDAGRVTEAARDYPQTPAGQMARTELARAEYDRAKTFKDPDQRRKALEAIVTSSLFTGTDAHMKAQADLAVMDGMKNPGNY